MLVSFYTLSYFINIILLLFTYYRLERIEYVDRLEERNSKIVDVKYLVFITKHYENIDDDKLYRFMIHINDIYLYECPFDATKIPSLSNAFIPSSIVVQSHHVINNNLIHSRSFDLNDTIEMTLEDSNLNYLKELRVVLAELVKQIASLSIEIVKPMKTTNDDPESATSIFISDEYLQTYISSLRLIQDFYQIMSITFEVYIYIRI